MNYWLDLFTGTTYKEFRDNGASISGFREKRRKTVESIKDGDILFGYITGIMRWVAALEVIGHTEDTKKIWKIDEFPARLKVRPIVLLEPENGIPMDALEGKVEFFKDSSDRKFYKGFLRGSPSKFQNSMDGELLLNLLKEAEKNPIRRHVDPKLLGRIPLYKVSQKVKGGTKEILVSVPEDEEISLSPTMLPQTSDIQYPTDHVMIQYRLLTIGAELGLDIWVARNDRSKIFKGKTLGSLPNILETLPTQFDEATQKTIEMIDVLWLKGNSIIAAFEVESTTSIFSGLLRMSDLLALQPNLMIKLYLVASDERRNKVKQEILRPTFARKERPLSTICGFISIEKLNASIDGIEKLGFAPHLKPEFLNTVSEYFTEENKN
jgi:hypothetical protein